MATSSKSDGELRVLGESQHEYKFDVDLINNMINDEKNLIVTHWSKSKTDIHQESVLISIIISLAVWVKCLYFL